MAFFRGDDEVLTMCSRAAGRSAAGSSGHNRRSVRSSTSSIRAMANILCMAGAHTNSMFVAAADRVGVERGQPFVGQSIIVSYTGWPIGGPASPEREEIIYAEANLADARRNAAGTDGGTTDQRSPPEPDRVSRRLFHPSDEVAAAAWNLVAIELS